MQIAQQVQQRNRATRVQNQLLTGIAAGESMQNVLARIQKGPDAAQDKGFIGNLMHIITAPFNPSLESSFPGQPENNLVQSFIRQQLTQQGRQFSPVKIAGANDPTGLPEGRPFQVGPTGRVSPLTRTTQTDRTQQELGRLLTNRKALLETIETMEDDGLGGREKVSKEQIQPGMENNYFALTEQIDRLIKANPILQDRPGIGTGIGVGVDPSTVAAPSVRPSPIQRSLQSILPTLSKEKQELVRTALQNGFSETEIFESLK